MTDKDPFIPDTYEELAELFNVPEYDGELLQPIPCPEGDNCPLADRQARDRLVILRAAANLSDLFSLVGVLKAHSEIAQGDRLEIPLRNFYKELEAYATRAFPTQ